MLLLLAVQMDAQRVSSTTPPTVHVGVSYQRTTTGFGISPTLGYRVTEGVEAVLQGSYSAYEFSKVRCLAFDSDTIALLPGSLFYLGDDQREANVYFRQRAELLTGVNLSVGDRVRVVSSFRFGASWISMESEIDSRTYAPVVRHPGVECGEPFQEFNRPSGPVALVDPLGFTTNAVAGVMSLGVGVEALTKEGWRCYAMLHNRQLIYGTTQFLVYDPRRPGFGSVPARIRDHAPSSEFRVEVGVMVPLAGMIF
ncbi:MAG: hypothetical protein AB8F78_10585 [Saprospiraceae bacterium]